jgi:hypothetical protein
MNTTGGTTDASAAADEVLYFVELADGDLQLARRLLAAAELGFDPRRVGDRDRRLLRPPDAGAMALIGLVPDGDRSTVADLFILAGYDGAYAGALLDRCPSAAPDPELVRVLLDRARPPHRHSEDH